MFFEYYVFVWPILYWDKTNDQLTEKDFYLYHLYFNHYPIGLPQLMLYTEILPYYNDLSAQESAVEEYEYCYL